MAPQSSQNGQHAGATVFTVKADFLLLTYWWCSWRICCCLTGHCLQVTAEEAHNGLRNLVYDIWSQGNCESHVDIIRMLGAIDFFLPFFPLEASNIQQLFTKRLAEQSTALLRSDAANLTWSAEVMDFLISKVRTQAHLSFTTLCVPALIAVLSWPRHSTFLCIHACKTRQGTQVQIVTCAFIGFVGLGYICLHANH